MRESYRKGGAGELSARPAPTRSPPYSRPTFADLFARAQRARAKVLSDDRLSAFFALAPSSLPPSSLESFVLTPRGIRFWFTDEAGFAIASVACIELRSEALGGQDLELRPAVLDAWAPILHIGSTAAPDHVEDVRARHGGK